MSVALPSPEWTVLSGPERVGSELRWQVRLADGHTAVCAQLLPELARDASIRRRYVRDLERVAALDIPAVARVREIGPLPDPRDPSAAAPWRLRDEPSGETLARWLDRRAPAPIDEACAIVAAVADAVHAIHERGMVLRDLAPRSMVVDADGTVVLTDIGLARVDVLSTRTAASLVLEGSPYAAPEVIVSTAIDGRCDVFTLGVLLFRALTGTLPWGDQPALLRDGSAAPRPSTLREGIPAAIDELCERALTLDRAGRPESALDVALVLRGRTRIGPRELTLAHCQACGAALRPAQRLCLACGKVAVLFEHAPDPALGRHAVELVKVAENADFLAKLRDTLSAVSAGPLPPLNFLVGDQRMYSKEEQARLLRLPLRLFDRVTEETAQRLHERLQALDIRTRVVDLDAPPMTPQKIVPVIFAAGAALVTGILVVIGSPMAVIYSLVGILAIVGIVVWAVQRRRGRRHHPDALLRLRSAPAALPASDPWVERLANLLREPTAEDVRERVAELALLVQRLVDHRIEHARERAEIDVVTAPVDRLVELIEREVARLRKIDADLAGLEEGAIVRALAASEARREPQSTRDALLAGLDRLRTLEDERARGFHRLLEASRLVRRAVELGLSVRDPALEHERQVALALRQLETE